MIGFQLRQAHLLECRVCKQYIDGERADRTKIMAMLFGTAPYAVCPCCWQEPDEHRDQNYRARFRRFMKRARHGLTIDAPMPTFKSPCGRPFEMLVVNGTELRDGDRILKINQPEAKDNGVFIIRLERP